MRITLLAALAIALCGCSLDPDDKPLEVLERIAGQLFGDGETSGTLEVMVTWHPSIPASIGQPPWLVGERGPVAGDDFTLNLRQAPPPEAQLGGGSLDWFADDFGEDVRMALGHIVVYQREAGAAPPGWRDLIEGPDARLVAVANERLLLWWDGPPPAEGVLPVQGGPIQPGYNAIRLDQLDGGLELVRIPLTDPWDLNLEPGGAWLGYERCRPDRLEPNPQEIWVNEGDEFPPGGTCVLCDRGMQVRDCVDVFGVLCSCWNPRLYRIDPNAPPDGWSCGMKPGQPCDAEGAEVCSINAIYRCEGGVWNGLISCNLDECCDPGCAPRPDFRG